MTFSFNLSEEPFVPCRRLDGQAVEYGLRNVSVEGPRDRRTARRFAVGDCRPAPALAGDPAPLLSGSEELGRPHGDSQGRLL